MDTLNAVLKTKFIAKSKNDYNNWLTYYYIKHLLFSQISKTVTIAGITKSRYIAKLI